MLNRAVNKYCTSIGFKVDIEDIQNYENSNLIEEVTFRVIGENAFGFIRSLKGIHRLVRKSPFDANNKRHTSFCAIDVTPEIDDSIVIDVKPEDIIVTVMRASGNGGQCVNTCDSKVRMQHIKTGIVVSSQISRSQKENREIAMNMLKSKLYELEESKKEKEQLDFNGIGSQITWGFSHVSWVLEPKQFIRDDRSGYKDESGIMRYLDGDLNDLVYFWLKSGKPKNKV
jgi:peptide chain release factor 2